MRKASLVRLVVASFAGLAAAIGLLAFLPRGVDARPAQAPGELDRFVFSSVGPTQTAGEGFTVVITAVDDLGDTVVSYTESVTLSLSTGGTILPSTTGAFSDGVRTETVTIIEAADDIAILAEDGPIGGTSEVFTVEAGALDYIVIEDASGGGGSPVEGRTVVAGETLPVWAIGYDAYDNYVRDVAVNWDWAGDGLGSLLPTSGVSTTFTAQVAGSDTIEADDADGPNAAAAITVEAAGLASFAFSSILSPQTAGVAFLVEVTAQDEFGNTVTDYEGPAVLTDTTGTISPTAATGFVGGVWSGDVSISETGKGVTIIVTDGDIEETSNAFDVAPGALVSFGVGDVASPQVAGVGFTVVITAYDGEGNVKTDYVGPAVLTDTTTTIDPTETGLFSLGVWSNTVAITKMVSGGTITVSAGTVEGTSNQFTVGPAPLDYIVISPTEATILAGAQQEYTATAFDEFDNLRGDVTGETQFTIEEEAGGTWEKNVYTSENYGDDWTVLGTYKREYTDEAKLTVLDTDLRLMKTDQRELVNAGDTLTYELTYGNRGNDEAVGVIITDTLSSYVQYVEDSCQTDVGTCRFEDGRVIFEDIVIPGRGEGQASLQVQVIDPLPAGALFVRNRASLKSPSSEVPFTVQDTDAIETRPDLAIGVKHAPSLFSPGEVMTFTVTYGNTGRMHAQGVVISATLPTGTTPTTETLATWDSSDGVAYTYVVGGDGELLAGEEERSVRFAIQHPNQPEVAAPRFTSSFSIAADSYTGGDADSSNNAVDYDVGAPDLIITDLKVAPWPLEPGVPVVFTITVKNRGTGWALNPENQGGFWADVFLDPVSSYPFERYSDRGIAVVCPPLAPDVEIELVVTEAYPWVEDLKGPILFNEQDVGKITAFYAKIDNFKDPAYGLVPEYDEANNVWPALSNGLYLPLVARGQ